MLSKHPPTNPVPYQGKLTIANAITDVTRLAGVQGDGAAYPDSSAGVWPAATNLVINGGFETNTTGWVAFGAAGATIERTTSTAKFGSACLKVTLGGSVSYDGASFGSLALTNGVTYTASAWVRCETGTLGLRIRVINTSSVSIGQTTFTATTSWQRVTITVTATADTPFAVNVLNSTGGASTAVYYIDGVQVETGSIATPYIESDGGTASRSLGRWYSATNARLNGNRGWIAVRFKCGGLASYTPLVSLQNDTDSGSENRVTIDSSAGVGRYRMERKDTSTTAQAALAAGDAFAAGDAGLIVARWSPTTVGFARGGGLGWNNTAATNTFSYNSHRLDTRQRWSPSTGSYSTQYWVAAGDGDMPDAGLDLMYGWGNNDPLPHMFPSSWGLCELSHFNGDGTFYRRSA